MVPTQNYLDEGLVYCVFIIVIIIVYWTSLQVDGSIFVVYNVGLTDHVVSDPHVKVNDGQYHVIKFVRSGANATLTIDDHTPQSVSPEGITILQYSSCELDITADAESVNRIIHDGFTVAQIGSLSKNHKETSI